MTNLKLKDSNGDIKIITTPDSLNANDLILNYLTYFRKYPYKEDVTIFFGNPVKKCFRRKLKYSKQHFKPKNETTNIINFVLNQGVLKINEVL